MRNGWTNEAGIWQDICSQTRNIYMIALLANVAMFSMVNTEGVDNDGYIKVWCVNFANNTLVFHKDTNEYGLNG